MGLTLTQAATEDPVTVEQARAQCRVTDDREDSQFQLWIKAATRFGEKITGRQFCTATWTLTLDSFPAYIELPLSRVQSVGSITYDDIDDAAQTLSSADYDLDATSEPAIISPTLDAVWPVSSGLPGSVRVVFTVGTSAADVPATIKQAILLMVGQFYSGREDPGKISQAAQALFDLEWVPQF